MRTLTVAAAVALILGTTAFGASTITYTLEIGGNNHADLWEGEGLPSEANPAFESPVTPVPSAALDASQLVTWDVIPLVTGLHSDGSGTAYDTNGIANLVFSLELYEVTGFDPGSGDPILGNLVDVVYQSTINDGDNDFGYRSDFLEAANFALGFDIDADGDFLLDGNYIDGTDPQLLLGPGQAYSTVADYGPNMDRAQFPTTASHAGGKWSSGSHTPNPANPYTNSGLTGQLVGMGVGYSQFISTLVSTGSGNVGGVGIEDILSQPSASPWLPDIYRGLGAVPIAEGQMDMSALPDGNYCLKVVPLDGHNIIPGTFDVYLMAHAGYSATATAFAEPANAVVGDQVCFEITGGGSGGCTATAVAWKSEKLHGGVPQAIALDATDGASTVEPRRYGVETILVDFDADPSPLSGTVVVTDTVNAIDTAAATQTLIDNGDGTWTLELTFAAGDLQDGCFAMDLVSNLCLADGSDTTVAFQHLTADVSGDGRTNVNDLLKLRSLLNTPVIGEDAKYDVSLDGLTNVNDMLLGRSVIGLDSPCLP